jgi:CO dehydrogenase/acetyl-CoA synthase gamma subunit (corrinoid Fe-S protein)
MEWEREEACVRENRMTYSCWATKWWNVMPVVLVEQDIDANPRKENGVAAGVRAFVNF